MMSSAFTKEVQTTGIIKVKYGQCVNIAYPKVAVDTKNTSHQIPVFFFLVCSMKIIFAKVRLGKIIQK